MKKTKQIHYKYTKILLIISFILSIFLFHKAFTLIRYVELVILFTFIFGSIGWTIDRFRPKLIVTFLLILFYALNLGFYIFHEINQVHCMGCRFTEYRNTFTDECKSFCVGCGIESPWFWKKDESCKVEIAEEICNKLTDEELSSSNGSCEDYLTMHGIPY